MNGFIARSGVREHLSVMAKMLSEMIVSLFGVGLLTGLLTAWVATLVSAF